MLQGDGGSLSVSRKRYFAAAFGSGAGFAASRVAAVRRIIAVRRAGRHIGLLDGCRERDLLCTFSTAILQRRREGERLLFIRVRADHRLAHRHIHQLARVGDGDGVHAVLFRYGHVFTRLIIGQNDATAAHGDPNRINAGVVIRFVRLFQRVAADGQDEHGIGAVCCIGQIAQSRLAFRAVAGDESGQTSKPGDGRVFRSTQAELRSGQAVLSIVADLQDLHPLHVAGVRVGHGHVAVHGHLAGRQSRVRYRRLFVADLDRRVEIGIGIVFLDGECGPVGDVLKRDRVRLRDRLAVLLLLSVQAEGSLLKSRRREAVLRVLVGFRADHVLDDGDRVPLPGVDHLDGIHAIRAGFEDRHVRVIACLPLCCGHRDAGRRDRYGHGVAQAGVVFFRRRLGQIIGRLADLQIDRCGISLFTIVCLAVTIQIRAGRQRLPAQRESDAIQRDRCFRIVDLVDPDLLGLAGVGESDLRVTRQRKLPTVRRVTPLLRPGIVGILDPVLDRGLKIIVLSLCDAELRTE